MAPAVQQLPPQDSSSTTCLLEFPFDTYTDVVDEHPSEREGLEGEPSSRGRQAWTPSLEIGYKDEPPLRQMPSQRCRWRRYLGRACCVFFVLLGIIQFISLAWGIVLGFFPDEYDRAAQHWKYIDDGHIVEDISHWPTDISRDIIPVACHSHNDYWRRVPLYSALQAGCIGVEADVWSFDEDELYVGHTRSSLTSRRTLRSMYVDPLVTILEHQNPVTRFQPRIDGRPLHGVFDTDPSQTLILLVDLKTNGAATWPAVVKGLAPLRERGYLTHFNGREVVRGPITVVGTGNTPFDLVTANSSYRDIFFDAPLDKLIDDNDNSNDNTTSSAQTPSDPFVTTRSLDYDQGISGIPAVITANTFNTTNSYYASVSFKKAIGFPWPFHFTESQMTRLRKQIRVAHAHGLKVRYWSLPSWPRSLRNHIWRILVQEGVDILNVDDLVAATKGDWNIRVFDWWL